MTEVPAARLPPPQWGRTAGAHAWLLHRRALLERLAAAAVLAACCAIAVFLHTRVLGAAFWIDEGIAVGIAHHGLLAIPGVLRQDGAPPLYYLLLHLWIGAFGDSETSVHALAAAAAVLAVPAAWWAASRPFGPGAALVAAALAAFNPFVGLYADEGRMYSLVFLLATLATGAFVRAFVLGERRQAAVFAMLLAALLYTHNWSVFFGAAAGVAMLGCAWALGSRRILVDGVAAFAGAAVLFAPWLPTAAFQAAHTGAPWSHRPSGTSLGRALTRILGGTSPEALLLVVALGGLAAALWRARRRDDGDRQPAIAAVAIAGLAAATLLIAWGYSQVTDPAWALRYLVIVLAPLVIVLAVGLRAAGPAGVLAVAVACALFWWGKPSTTTLIRKSNADQLAARLGPQLRPGATLLSIQPEQVPVLRYYLGPRRIAYRTPTGPVADPQVTDWRDALARLRAARYPLNLQPVVRALPTGGQLLVVSPRFGRPDAPWTRRIATIGREWRAALRADPGLRAVARVAPPAHGENRAALSAVLYERRATAP